MRFVWAAVAELMGLFVSDWVQSIGILVILGSGYIAGHLLPTAIAGFGVAVLLAALLLCTTSREAARRQRSRSIYRET